MYGKNGKEFGRNPERGVMEHDRRLNDLTREDRKQNRVATGGEGTKKERKITLRYANRRFQIYDQKRVYPPDNDLTRRQ